MTRNLKTVSVGSARRAAFDILSRVENDGSYASVLVAALPQSGLSREDRALAQEIVLGVLRWQKTLDYFIEKYSKRSVERLDLPVLLALRIGLYQLRYLTRIPHSAAVNESVKLIKAARATSAATLVNAVLRNAARHPDDLPGALIEDQLDRLSVELSHPRWLLKRWAALWGDKAAQNLAQANNETPVMAFRVNSLAAEAGETIARLMEQGVTTRSSRFVPGAFVVEGRETRALIQAAEQGQVYLQDEASQLISLILDPQPGDWILDLCAAPGSKTTHIADLTNNKSLIIACDVHAHRLASLKSACKRLGVEVVECVAMDAKNNLPFLDGARKFERVLVDAPCTGTGTLRRNPEIKWRLKSEDIQRLSEIQFALITRAAPMVVQGGRLVYSTCSIEPEENEEVIARFLESHSEFRLIKPSVNAGLIVGDFVRTFPHENGMDGFVASVLERA